MKKSKEYNYSFEEKKRLVSQWRQSNLTRREFCEQNNLSFNKFRNWITIINQSNCSKFIDIEVVKPPTLTSAIIHYPNGVKLEIPTNCNLSELKQLIYL